MKFNKAHKDKIKKNWKEFIRKSTPESLYYGDERQPDEFNKICKLIFSKSTIKAHITKEEILSFITNWLHAHAEKKKDDWNFEEGIENAVSAVEINKGATRLMSMLEGLPYKCTAFFPLHLQIPEEINSLKISNNIKILQSKEIDKFYENKTSPLIKALAGGAHYNAQYYLCITTNGYPGIYGDGHAIVEAVQKLREFIYLSGLLKYGEMNTYKRPSLWPDCFYVSGITGTERQNFSISQSTIYGLENFSFKDTIWEPKKILPPPGAKSARTLLTGAYTAPEKGHKKYAEAIEQGFQEKIKWVTNFLSIEKSRTTSVSRAIEWGFMGKTNHDLNAGFIQTCIGLEAVIGDSEHVTSERLYDRASYMLGKSQKERKEIYDNFKNIYALRSSVVHGNVDIKTKAEKGLTYQAGWLLERILINEINMLLINETS